MSNHTVTLVVEMKTSEDCPWIWESFRGFLLQNKNDFRHGVRVIGMRESNCLKMLTKAEQEIAELREQLARTEREVSRLSKELGCEE